MSAPEWEWSEGDADSRKSLPPDLTTMFDWCPARWRGDKYGCTRPSGHSGRHAAGDGQYITAVWGDRS